MSKSNKLLALSGALAAGMIASPAAAEGWYGGGFVGLASVDDVELDGTGDLEFDNEFTFGGFVGKQFGENLRVEGELSYLGASPDCIGKCSTVDFDVSVLTILGNVWVDIPVGNSFTPYVGGGVGYGSVEIDTDGLGSEDDSGLAYQVGFGVRLGESRAFDVGYRYRAVSVELEDFSGDDVDATAHVFQVGWTGRF